MTNYYRFSKKTKIGYDDPRIIGTCSQNSKAMNRKDSNKTRSTAWMYHAEIFKTRMRGLLKMGNQLNNLR